MERNTVYLRIGASVSGWKNGCSSAGEWKNWARETRSIWVLVPTGSAGFVSNRTFPFSQQWIHRSMGIQNNVTTKLSSWCAHLARLPVRIELREDEIEELGEKGIPPWGMTISHKLEDGTKTCAESIGTMPICEIGRFSRSPWNGRVVVTDLFDRGSEFVFVHECCVKKQNSTSWNS